MAEENRRLRREVSELRKSNEVLKAASIFFAKELDQPRSKGSDSSMSIVIVSGSSSFAAPCVGQFVGFSRLVGIGQRNSGSLLLDSSAMIY